MAEHYSVADVIQGATKKYGENTMQVGLTLAERARIPTGIFAFDVATGGGIPVGTTTVLYGPKSSGKTNILLKTIAQFQKLYPDKVALLMDLEFGVTTEWAQALGVDTEHLVVARPKSGEDAVNMVGEVMLAEDLGILGLDSLAMLTSTKEVEGDANIHHMAGNSMIVGRMCRRIGNFNARRETLGMEPLAPIIVNQVRQKVGQLFGDPEGMPGGNAIEHLMGLQVRVYGKDKHEKDLHPTLPAWKETRCIIKKHKLPIVGTHFEYAMSLINQHGGLGVGQCEELGMVTKHLAQFGDLSKLGGQKWQLFGEEFKSKTAAVSTLTGEALDKAKERVVEHLLKEQADAIGKQV